MISISEFEENELIFSQGDSGDSAFVIESGKVKIFTEKNGETHVLAYLGPQETFGEMSMIEEIPRSASARAEERTRIREIHRDKFMESLRTNPESALNLLKVLFERLRESNMNLILLKAKIDGAPRGEASGEQVKTFPEPVQNKEETTLILEGITSRAAASLQEKKVTVSHFPYRIGRLSGDPLVHNDLVLEDTKPLQVSRNHMCFILQDGKIGAFDRGSHMGTLVDGRPLGSQTGFAGPVFFQGGEGTLQLGNSHSDFKYRITVQ